MDTSGRVVVTTTQLNGPGRPNQSIFFDEVVVMADTIEQVISIF